MNDRELLEYAAKAAGLTLYWHNGVSFFRPELDWHDAWNPLTDDGDALRLAVKLKFGVDIEQDYTAVLSRDKITCIIARSTRRAIVRAAAEIGKAMQ